MFVGVQDSLPRQIPFALQVTATIAGIVTGVGGLIVGVLAQ